MARKDDDGKRRHGSVRDARLETAHVRRPRRDGWIRPETVRREKRPQYYESQLWCDDDDVREIILSIYLYHGVVVACVYVVDDACVVSTQSQR